MGVRTRCHPERAGRGGIAVCVTVWAIRGLRLDPCRPPWSCGLSVGGGLDGPGAAVRRGMGRIPCWRRPTASQPELWTTGDRFPQLRAPTWPQLYTAQSWELCKVMQHIIVCSYREMARLRTSDFPSPAYVSTSGINSWQVLCLLWSHFSSRWLFSIFLFFFICQMLDAEFCYKRQSTGSVSC